MSQARRYPAPMADEIRLWFWTITNEVTGCRMQTTGRMTEGDARERHGADAVTVEDSLEVRHNYGHASDFMRGQSFRAGDFAANSTSRFQCGSSGIGATTGRFRIP